MNEVIPIKQTLLKLEATRSITIRQTNFPFFFIGSHIYRTFYNGFIIHVRAVNLKVVTCYLTDRACRAKLPSRLIFSEGLNGNDRDMARPDSYPHTDCVNKINTLMSILIIGPRNTRVLYFMPPEITNRNY